MAWPAVILRGTMLGLTTTLVLTRALPLYARSLNKTDPHGTTVCATVVFVLVFAVTLASWLPARRAAKIAPMIALRAE